MPNKDSEAFPMALNSDDYSTGLTKREYVATRILSALLSNNRGHQLIGVEEQENTSADKYIDYSIRMTDLLFEKLVG